MSGQTVANGIAGEATTYPWRPLSLADGESAEARFGPLELRLRRAQGELWVASRRDEGWSTAVTKGGPSPTGEAEPGRGGGLEETEPETLEWTRWAAAGESVPVRLAPALADRPVVVAPETSFHLTPGTTARIYVRIPLWVRVSIPSGSEATLMEVPTIIMSDTWWGDFASGELAYWLPTTARRRVTDDLFGPHLVMCPLELVNESDEVLSVEKLAVRVVHMSIYRDGPKLWGSETSVCFESHDEGSRIDLEDGPPREAPKAELMTPPRERPERGFRARTFGRFKDIAGM